MASNTQILEKRRKIKKAAAGKERKKYFRLHGSTKPDLPLDKPNANELARKKLAKKKK